MLTIFNRTELLLTQDRTQLHAVESALKAAGIDYAIKLRDPSGHPYERAKLGALGKPPTVECIIYVNRKDADRARHILAQVRQQRETSRQ